MAYPQSYPQHRPPMYLFYSRDMTMSLIHVTTLILGVYIIHESDERGNSVQQRFSTGGIYPLGGYLEISRKLDFLDFIMIIFYFSFKFWGVFGFSFRFGGYMLKKVENPWCTGCKVENCEL